MKKLIYILLIVPFLTIGQNNPISIDKTSCVIESAELDCQEVQNCITSDFVNALVVHPTPLLNIIECDGPFVVQSPRTGWWGTWSPIYTTNSGTVTEDWVAVRSVTSPECVTDASIDFDMGLTYYQLRRMRMYFWIDWRVLVNGVAVYTETYDVYHYDDHRQDTNPDIIPPNRIMTHDNGYANAVRLNVPANATVAIETRQRYNFNGAQTSAYGRVISGLRSNHKVDFELRSEITEVSIQSVDEWWVLEELMAYTAGFGEAPEGAKTFKDEKEYQKALVNIENKLEKENLEFVDSVEDEDSEPIFDINDRIEKDLLTPNAESTIKGKYKVGELRQYAKDKGFDCEGNETVIVQCLIENTSNTTTKLNVSPYQDTYPKGSTTAIWIILLIGLFFFIRWVYRL